ncbi:hypothetical protein GCM10027028_44550 [Streptomyces sundarbansensis]
MDHFAHQGVGQVVRQPGGLYLPGTTGIHHDHTSTAEPGRACRLGRWQKAGVFDQLHRVPLSELNAAGELDWSRACVDGSHVRAKRGMATPVRHRSTGARRAASTT